MAGRQLKVNMMPMVRLSFAAETKSRKHVGLVLMFLLTHLCCHYKTGLPIDENKNSIPHVKLD